MCDLMTSLEACVEGTAIDIKSDIPVGEKDRRDLASLSQLREVYPVLNTVFGLAIVVCRSSMPQYL